VQPFWQLAGQFAGDAAGRQPSRLYARSTVLEVGEPLSPDAVVADLTAQGYRPAEAGGPPPPGRFHRADGVISVHQRRFPTPKGPGGGEVLTIAHNGRRVRSLELAGETVPAAWLDPVLIAAYYGDDLVERRPVEVERVPEDVIWAVLAAEDAGFYEHGGVSLTGIARAAWVNFRGGEVRQGGSTLTQQLVKNLYLTHERTLARKAREAILAVLLEARYTKDQILEAYLNEIYTGASNGVSLVGIAAASRAYFGAELDELSLAEAAMLGGLIQSPARWSPTAHPEDAEERRDWVLDRMAELGYVEPERADAAKAEPLEPRPRPVVRRAAAYFADFVAREAEERFGLGELDDAGYELLSTLDARDQQAAQEAVAWGVKALEEGWEKSHRGDEPLQAALVSVDPERGGVLAYVGGRSYQGSQFDRAGMALRQAGSAFKPVVYAAAFERGLAYPASFVEDAPLTVRLAGRRWTPKNSDGSYHGWVSVRSAVEDSLNVATARLGLQVGLERIVDMARRLGVEAPLEPVPAIALGAFEVTPLQLATVYATLAAGGERPPVHGLTAVLGPGGEVLETTPLPAPERVISRETAYLMTSVLQGVLDRGTAASARRQGVQGDLAGKTGTTNDQRDAWFAGYSPDRVSVVWVGYDSNASSNLSGTRAGVPIWSRFTVAVRPPGGYPSFEQPPGIVTAVVDPTTGLLATDDCPYVLTEVYRRDQVPDRVCHVHRSYYDDWYDDDRWARNGRGRGDRGDAVAGPPRRDGGWAGEPVREPPAAEPAERAEEEERRHPFRRWLRRVFGPGEEDDGGDGGDGGGDGGDGGGEDEDGGDG